MIESKIAPSGNPVAVIITDWSGSGSEAVILKESGCPEFAVCETGTTNEGAVGLALIVTFKLAILDELIPPGVVSADNCH